MNIKNPDYLESSRLGETQQKLCVITSRSSCRHSQQAEQRQKVECASTETLSFRCKHERCRLMRGAVAQCGNPANCSNKKKKTPLLT